jgi:trimeric autotransporter adhesin
VAEHRRGDWSGRSLTTGSDDIYIGFQIDAIGGGESNTIRIGSVQTRTFIAGIGVATVTGTPVVVNASGQLGVAPSSQRFKDEIKSMDNTSEAILALKPVTFRYKQEIDSSRALQFGLVAEEVERVNPDLVVRAADGEIYTVRYDAVNARLLNEFLTEHRKVQELEAIAAKQEATAANQQKEIKALTASLKEQAWQIQKVSAALEVSKPAPQTVLNDQ